MVQERSGTAQEGVLKLAIDLISDTLLSGSTSPAPFITNFPNMPRKWSTLYEKDIPDWIRDSPYLQSLLENGPLPEEGLQVPKLCLKRNTTINCYNDALQFLRTARYWLLPDSVFNESEFFYYCFHVASNSDLEALEQEHPLVQGLAAVVSAPDAKKLVVAAAHGTHIVLSYLCCDMWLQMTSAAVVAAISAGHVACLRFFRYQGWRLTSHHVETASLHGRLACLRYLRRNGIPLTIDVVCYAMSDSEDHRQCLEYAL